ncbi:TetR/AcrR family transcriptional regulator [Clostridium sp. LP20]|uniref:TetR/AcrR family transcriptional regulator n=1 Tax=Clostridium sp. LP20 TaxID=3418665 RepID=UPI003EE81990
MRELKNVEERILDRALYLFGKNGSTNVPIRTIVKEAGVNVSAINYYFGSKDRMLSYVQEFYINNILMAYEPLDNNELSDEEKLINCSNEIIEYSIRYPGVLVMNKEASNAEEKSEMDIKIINIINEANKKLDNVLRSVMKCNEEEFIYKRMIFLSSILHPFINETNEIFNEEILVDKNSRINYIKYIINTLKIKE